MTAQSPQVPQSPLTGGDNVSLVRVYPAEELIGEWQRRMQIDITDELKGERECRLYRCHSSQLEFFHPFNLAGSGRLYEQLARRASYYMPDKWEHLQALSRVRPGEELLEVGSGQGEFLLKAMEKGAKAMGIELNEQGMREAQKRGCDCVNLDLELAAQKWPGRFDVVCAFQVLEHIPAPLGFLRHCCTLLKPGGRLILGVPDGNGWVSRSFNLLDLPPHHMTRWNAGAFQYLTTCLPLEIENLGYEPLAPHHVRSYFESALLPWPESNDLSGFRKRTLKTLAKVTAGLFVRWNLYRSLPGHSMLAVFRKKAGA